jgi:DNA mismatch repair protein MutS
MSFEIDNQTLNDLDIFPKTKKANSIFKLFDKTKTTGGQNALINMMKEPSDDIEFLSERVKAIHFLQNNNTPFYFTERILDFIEHYLKQNTNPLKKGFFHTIGDLIDYSFQESNDYYLIEKGLRYLRYFIIQLKKYIVLLQDLDAPLFFQNFINEANTIIDDGIIQQLLFINIKSEEAAFIDKGLGNKINSIKTNIKWNLSINNFDNSIRSNKKDDFLNIFNFIYQIDVLITVAKVAKDNNFCLPVFLQNKTSRINIENTFHPFINQPVTNNIGLDKDKNMCFLTGANMAGKSTFLKAVGLCCYMAHLGFPVPANKMETSVFSGLITTINLADDLSNGYSHFYSEVKRVKNTALKIQEKRRLVVIFDELFRGTNVKDAYDSSLAIISGFSDISPCAFFISTHIVEIADELKSRENIVFKYFDSKVNYEKPVFSYKLVNGISNERHGLQIVKNEKIIEILDQIIKENNAIT